MKAISYALFGYDRTYDESGFNFNSYLRGLHLNIRFNRIIYPGWQNVLNIDEATYHSPYKPIFDWHRDRGFIRINICPNGEMLCKAMLWRLKTIFFYKHPEWEYSHVICRDLDSIATFREAQMVQEWINEDKTIHCITDSISHDIPMMGGMVGFKPSHFHSLMGLTGVNKEPWDVLIARTPFPESIYTHKGADQTFMNQVIYPTCSQSATEHFIKGMPHNLKEQNGRHYSVNETLDIGVDPRHKETNLLCGHVGAAGYYQPGMENYLKDNDPFKAEYKDLEVRKEFGKIFYWELDKI